MRGMAKRKSVRFKRLAQYLHSRQPGNAPNTGEARAEKNAQ
jgi:hypothetical protein